MPSIFHRLRKKLLEENKIKSYLTYAIGEIILIVFGILIALAINNWNQNRILKEKEQFYLEGLKGEFEQSKIKLENLIDVNRLNYEESKKLASFIHNPNKPEEKELSEMLYNAFSFDINYYPNNSLLEELMNSGGLKNISNANLRKYLTAWDSRIQVIHRQENSLREQREKMLDIFRSDNASIKTILDLAGVSTNEMGIKSSSQNFSNLSILDSKEFENNLLLFILNGIITEQTHYKPLLQEIDIILQLIESEIR